MKFKVLVTDKLAKKGIEVLNRYKEIEVIEKETMSPEDLKKEIGQYHGIIVRSQTKLTAEIIEAADNLKVIARAGVGVDNIDIPAATERGIVVMNAPSGNTISAAELTFAQMIAIARKLPFAYASLKLDRKWDRKSFKGVELMDKTLGIIGTGRIGTEVGKRAKAFGMKVIAYDPYLSEEKANTLGFELSDLDSIYKKADFITIHTPLTDQTRGMIGMKELKKMKPSVRIINCARGGIIEEQALADMLKEGLIAGAAIDVYSKEPPTKENNPLLDAPNCITLPHLGASTEEAQFNVAIESAEGVANYLLSNMVVNSLNMPSVSKEVVEQMRPYINIAEKMGSMLYQLIEGQIQDIKIFYEGELAFKDVTILTRAGLKGFFAHVVGSSVNYVNAMNIAKSRGIKITEQKEEEATEFTNLIRIRIKSDQETIELCATVYGGKKEKIVKFNDYYFELDPSGIILAIYNEDKPGVIGKLGTVLGENGVNIAGMRLGRNAKTKMAVTLLQVDHDIDDELKQSLLAIDEIEKLKIIRL